MHKAISVIIPTYNEKDNIAMLLEKLHSVLFSYNYEIIFIDDNSRDGTAEFASDLARKYPVKVIIRKNKRGLASAVVDGLTYVNNEIIVVMDADLQHPPAIIPALLRGLEDGADIVIASRYVKGGACQGWGRTRKIMSKGAIFLAHLSLPSIGHVSDPVSGFFVLNRHVIDRAVLKPIGFKILLEILIEGQFQRIAEVPYTFRDRSGGESKLGARQQMDYLKHIYSLMRRAGEPLRFLKFCLVGLSGVLINIGLLWSLTEFAGLFYLFSAAISIETAIVSNFTLNNYFTFRDRRSTGIKSFLNRLTKFNLVSLVGLGINLGIIWLLTEVLGIYYLLSNLCGIAIATLWNYLANSRWTWKQQNNC